MDCCIGESVGAFHPRECALHICRLKALLRNELADLRGRGLGLLALDTDQRGLVFAIIEKDLEDTLLKALHLTDPEYQELSAAAREKIKQEFSEDGYYYRLKQLYDMFQPGN